MDELNITYPDLPVASRREEIVRAVVENPVVVVVGETGSGKTTQLPKMAIEAARELGVERGRVGCTQPRRLAAATVARRVASELGTELGQGVGFQVRFEDKTSEETALKFMTDGILLAETQNDASLRQYHTIILDEAHERSLNIDFLLGYLKNLLLKRKDLRVLISSATLDAGGFSDFFDGAPVIEVEGRAFAVETFFLPPEETDYGREEDLSQHVARAVEWVGDVDEHGDVLVFLPGEREIRECAEVLEGRDYYNTEVLPLFARMGLNDQQRIFSPGGKRRIVLATNVAETSLTIPGIVFVIDSGLARVSRYSPGRSVQRLQIEPVSQASARQRMGRCGRVREGICVRLYDEESFDERPEFTDPEIRRSSLAGVILRMKSLRLPEISEFPLVDPPSPKLISEGYRTLREIGAVDKRRELTRLGKTLAGIPVDPQLGRMLVEAKKEGCPGEAAVLVAGLSIMDVRERPAEKTSEADAAQKKWKHVESDFLGMLLLWAEVRKFKEKGRKWRRNQLRKFCRQHFLNFNRVIEWDNLVNDLVRGSREIFGNGKMSEVADSPERLPAYEAVHRALLAGVPRQFGLWDREKRSYRGAGGREFAIFPGSGLFQASKRHEWVLAMELVDTSRLWARKVAKIDPAWVEQVAPHLCRSSFHSAAWNIDQGVVQAKENVVCGGLRIIDGRRVHYGRVHPEGARIIFIREGLLGGGMKSPPECLKQVAGLRKEVLAMEQALRRPDGLWSEESLVAYFEDRIPPGMCTAKAFHQWCTKNPDVLRPAIGDVIYEDPERLGLDDFPESLEHEGEEYGVYYRTAPGEPDDGVTFGLHIDQLAMFPDWLLEWGVRGNLDERVRTLIRSLPKDLRRLCNPASESARAFLEMNEGAPPSASLHEQLAEFLRSRTGQRIAVGDFDLTRLPAHLITKVWVGDDEGNTLGLGREIGELRRNLGTVVKTRFEQAASRDWRQSGMRRWDCGELPLQVEAGGGSFAYPALTDEGSSVGVKAFAGRDEAEDSHRSGCVRLLHLVEADQAAYVTKSFPLGWEIKVHLPAMGKATIPDLVSLAGEMAMRRAGDLPRDEEAFRRSAQAGRQHWYECAEILSASLEKWIPAWREVCSFIDGARADQNLHAIAEDLEEEVDWLLRAEFLKQAGAGQILDYARYFEAMRTRIGRLRSLPLAKDLEKMKVLRHYWEPWLREFVKRPGHHALIHAGWRLEEWRISLFAPGSPVKGKISEKRISDLLESLGAR